ncbi:MAG: DNA starvation/stationary phase protection protein [Akkermansiaceae bacterium]|nr:DNA starvation/stationary phase protection protein [Akkermansiaceae bacterium]NNM29228.1 DNA starvation/stationary phase protection protein [Akkermansiaceae bacterium]
MNQTITKKSEKTEVPENAGSEQVVTALRQVVADTYALMGQTHLCHWNVRGPGFFALHEAFEQQYTELFEAVDEIAERVRALGALAPGGLGNLAAMAGMTELNEDAGAKEMVRHLAAVHRHTVANLTRARDLAGEADDNESEDLVIARIQVHEKTIWMLESFLEE